MKFIDHIISFSTIKHLPERTVFELGFKIGLKQKSHLTEIQTFSHFVKTVNFLFALIQIINSLPIMISNSSTVLYIMLSLILAHICSNLLSEINEQHFSAFIFISLISNHLK